MQATTTKHTLSYEEQRALDAHERVIQNGLDAWMAVADAMADIRNRRLYRAHYRNFGDYCKQRWGLKKRRVNQLIASAEVARDLGTIVPLSEATRESHLRPLVGLESDARRIVWDVVSQTAPDGHVTERHVRNVVDVLGDVLNTRAIDGGDGNDIPIERASVTHLKDAVLETTVERIKRHETYIRQYAERQDRPQDVGSIVSRIVRQRNADALVLWREPGQPWHIQTADGRIAELTDKERVYQLIQEWVDQYA